MKRAFEQAVTLKEIFTLTKQFKEAGEDPEEVNILASKRKREIMKLGVSRQSKFVRITPQLMQTHGLKHSNLAIVIEHVNSGVIRLTENSTIEI